MMNMSHITHEASVATVKGHTSLKWFLNDWKLLYDCYYKPGAKSREFAFNNLEASHCTCQLTVIPMITQHKSLGQVEIMLHGMGDFLTMEIKISAFYAGTTALYCLMDRSVSGQNVVYPIVVQLNDSIKKKGIDGCMSNGALILLFDFTIVKSLKNSLISTKNLSSDVRTNLQEIRGNGSLCDVTFVIGDKQLCAHKVILAANSEYFKAMFTSGMKEETEDTVHILDTDATMFEVFLDYLYTGKVDNLDKLVDDLIIIADKYQNYELKELCEKFISDRL